MGRGGQISRLPYVGRCLRCRKAGPHRGDRVPNMRIWMTGGTGFVGSDIVHEAVKQGHDVVTTYRSYRPSGYESHVLRRLNMLDRAAVLGDAKAFAPDILIHCAILNDLGALYRDRHAAWNTYVEATRITAEAER